VRRTCRCVCAGAEPQLQRGGGMRPTTAAAAGGVLGCVATGGACRAQECDGRWVGRLSQRSPP
jgi:hypothetical protein